MAKKEKSGTSTAKTRTPRKKSAQQQPEPAPANPVNEQVLTPDANEHPAAIPAAPEGEGSPELEVVQETVDTEIEVADNIQEEQNTVVEELNTSPDQQDAIQEPIPAQQEADKPADKKEGPEEFKVRNPLTGMFTKEEREYVEIHIAARKRLGLTRDNNHFVRQCVNFCINYTKGWTFGRANVQRKTIEE